jgi:hypothetical protein
MPGIVGMGTTFNLPNFVGDLFSITPDDTPLLSRIGGLTGGVATPEVTFEWQFYDLRDPDADRQRVEGADAPIATNRVRVNADNVVEIHQEAVEISYTRQGTGQGGFGTALRGPNPVSNELAWQMDAQLKQVARDVELSFIVGTYAKPSDNTQPRKTRGLLESIVTNVKDMNGATPTEEDFNDLFQIAYQNGGLGEGDTRTIIVGPSMKRLLTKLYITDHDLQPLTRNVGGVNLTVIDTDFGRADIMLDRFMPDGVAIAASLEELVPRFLTIPGKGHFFWEPLAKTGASDRSQLYGEIGLQVGNERKHAKLVDATSPYDSVGVGSGS